MTIHTTGMMTFKESEYEPNRFTIGANGNWLMSIQHNGEPSVQVQRENMRRLVACWNACEGSSTEWLEFQCNPDAIEQFGAREPFETRYTNELRKAVTIKDQRDELLIALKGMVHLASFFSKLDKEPVTQAARNALAKGEMA